MRVLFLSNNDVSLPLYDFLASRETSVKHRSLPLSVEASNASYDYLISYNYKHIIPKQVLESFSCPKINLHISLLPHNQGVAPNLFSFLNDTPKGVSIHELVSAVDEGDLLLQQEMFFDENVETLRTTYQKLHGCIQKLFVDHWHDLRRSQVKPYPQSKGEGSYHTLKELDMIERRIGKGIYDITIHNLKQRML